MPPKKKRDDEEPALHAQQALQAAGVTKPGTLNPDHTVAVPLVRVQLVQDRTLTLADGDPAPIPALIRQLLYDADREKLVVIHLDGQANVLSAEIVAMGALNMTYVQPRDVFKGALLANASAVILAHGHPGGEAFPSSDDLTVTKRMIRAGELLEVPIWDHFILGATGKLLSLRDTTALWEG